MLKLLYYRNSQVSVEFTSSIQLPKADAQEMLDELAALDTYFPHLGHTELAISKDDTAVKIRKDHTLQQTEVDSVVTQDLFTAINEKLGTQLAATDIASIIYVPDFKEDMAEACIKALIQALPVEGTVKEELIAKGKQLAGEQGQKYVETSTEANQIQGQIEAQRQRDTLQLVLKDMQAQAVAIEEQLSQVHSLIVTRDQVAQSTKKYAYLLNKDVDRDAVKFREDIVQIRHEQLADKAANDSPSQRRGQKEEFSWPRQGNFLLVAALITVAIGGVFTIVFNSQFLFAGIGMIAALMQVGCWYLLNQVSPQALFNLQIAAKAGTKTQSKPARIAAQILQKLAFLEKFFIDKAWLSAIRAEADNISAQISQRLQGADHDAAMGLKRQIQQTIAAVTVATRASAKSDIPPDQYLQKRRQLDTLKVEKMRLEGDLYEHQAFSELLDLTSFESTNSHQAIVPAGVMDGVASIRVGSDDELEFKVGEIWRKQKISSEQSLALLSFLRVQIWVQNPELPLLLVNLNSVPEGVLNAIHSLLQISEGKGQVISLNYS